MPTGARKVEMQQTNESCSNGRGFVTTFCKAVACLNDSVRSSAPSSFLVRYCRILSSTVYTLSHAATFPQNIYPFRRLYPIRRALKRVTSRRVADVEPTVPAKISWRCCATEQNCS